MKTKFLIFFLLFLIGHMASYSQESKTPAPSLIDLKLTKKSETGNRPHSLESDQVIYCFYEDGILYLELPSSIDGGTVNIYNSNQGWMGYLTREFPEVEIPFTSGSYTIELFTNDGRVYTGIIDL